jgi:hypothetical protein
VGQFVERGEIWIAFIAGGVLLLLQVPGVGGLIEELGLEDSRQLRTAVAVVLLMSILLELYQLKRRVTPAISDRQQYPDPKEMYDALIEKAKSITDPEQQKIEVLGLTLYSAWPQISFFLERPEINNWTVKFATMSKEATAPRQWTPPGWPDESNTTVNQVREFASGRGAEHSHRIEIFEYHFTPAVHGFRLGNGDVFVSVLHWQEDGRLGKHRFSYDYVPAHDISPAAAAVRGLFNNWFERAVRSASEAEAMAAVLPSSSPG